MHDLNAYEVTVEAQAKVTATFEVVTTSTEKAERMARVAAHNAPQRWDEPQIDTGNVRVVKTVSANPIQPMIGDEPNDRPKVLVVRVPKQPAGHRLGVYVVKGGYHELAIVPEHEGQDDSVAAAADALARALDVYVEYRTEMKAPSSFWEWPDVTRMLNAESQQVAPFVICANGPQGYTVYWNEHLGWGGIDDAQVYQARDVAMELLPDEGFPGIRWGLNPKAFPGTDKATEEDMVNELKCFCFIEELPFMDAYEILESPLSQRQKRWIEDYIERWDVVVTR